MASAFLRYRLPPILWSLMILAASSDLFSASHTGGLLATVLDRLFFGQLPESVFELIHFLVRKCGHLTAYGIAAALNYRALRPDAHGWSARASVVAVSLALALAIADETHQSFIPSRTGTAGDVAIDTLGATLAQFFVRLRFVRSS